jgi:small GTP-binding protein
MRIEVVTKKIDAQLDDGKIFHLLIYEIPIGEEFLNEKQNAETINSFLYESQCTLFLFDITEKKSFDLIKQIVDIIDFEKLPYMKSILVQNKIDIGDSTIESEISEFLNSNTSFETIKISNKDKMGINDLKMKIYSSVNNPKNQLPMNIISESIAKNQKLVNGQGYLSFILIGDTTVGKTCFYNRFFRDTFSLPHLTTIGIEKESKLVKIYNEIYKITLWDTAGQERFKCLPRKYYQNADGIFLLFDVTKEETFNNVSSWIKDVKDNSNRSMGGNGNNDTPAITLFLLGNKIDAPGRVISSEQAEKLASSLGMKYFEISCKLNMNIPEIMSRMVMESYMKTNKIEKVSDLFTLDRKKIKKKTEKKGCC